MALPFVFQTATGNVGANELDINFNAVGGIGVIQATCTGINALVLTPIANQVAITLYTQLQLFAFKAAATNTGTMTVNINTVGVANLVHADGTAMNAGDIAAGAVVTISFDGTNFQLLSAVQNDSGRLIAITYFTSSGTWNPNGACASIIVDAVGGGAGGGGGAGNVAQSAAGGGGGGGSRAVKGPFANPGSQTVTIPAAAGGGSAGNNPGTVGGDVTFGAIVTAKGGGQGGGAATGTAVGISGNYGLGIAGSTGDFTSIGGDAGAGVRLTSTSAYSGHGGASPISGSCGPVFATAGAFTGNSGDFPGGGGGGGVTGGSASNAAGGPGAKGVCIIYEYT